MKYQDALALKRGDRLILKKGCKQVTVNAIAPVMRFTDWPHVWINVIDKNGTEQVVVHTDVLRRKQ